MTWRAGTVGLFLLAVGAAGAAEPAAPLANSAQELKTLQRDQTTKNSGVANGKLSESLPQMQGPTPGAPLLELARQPKSDAELKELKRKAAQKNWLIDGVDQLGKNSAAKSRGTRDTKETGIAGEEEKLDSSDPEYILKLYSELQKEVEAKAGAKQAATPQADPFAPFLQGWLGSSPARGKFFDESIRRPDASLGTTTPGGLTVSGNNRVFSPVEVAVSTWGAVVEAQPNPYLSGLDLPSLPEAGGSRTAAALNLGPVTKSLDSKPADLPGGTQPAVRAAEKKPLPSALAEDNKYFPQLKKF
ncbi:MAG: hypothetical protein EXS42_02280 [Lacunisphaera sp.]|nr:hypothetical protein [Lacunisphaera sp.]